MSDTPCEERSPIDGHCVIQTVTVEMQTKDLSSGGGEINARYVVGGDKVFSHSILCDIQIVRDRNEKKNLQM